MLLHLWGCVNRSLCLFAYIQPQSASLTIALNQKPHPHSSSWPELPLCGASLSWEETIEENSSLNSKTVEPSLGNPHHWRDPAGFLRVCKRHTQNGAENTRGPNEAYPIVSETYWRFWFVKFHAFLARWALVGAEESSSEDKRIGKVQVFRWIPPAKQRSLLSMIPQGSHVLICNLTPGGLAKSCDARTELPSRLHGGTQDSPRCAESKTSELNRNDIWCFQSFHHWLGIEIFTEAERFMFKINGSGLQVL